jgi:hypothetical protein
MNMTTSLSGRLSSMYVDQRFRLTRFAIPIEETDFDDQKPQHSQVNTSQLHCTFRPAKNKYQVAARVDRLYRIPNRQVREDNSIHIGFVLSQPRLTCMYVTVRPSHIP